MHCLVGKTRQCCLHKQRARFGRHNKAVLSAQTSTVWQAKPGSVVCTNNEHGLAGKTRQCCLHKQRARFGRQNQVVLSAQTMKKAWQVKLGSVACTNNQQTEGETV